MASRTPVDRELLDEAQGRVGLSNERLAALIPVSEKTWRRWKAAGAIPTYALGRIAEVLQLELTEVQPEDGPASLSLQRLGAAGVAQLLEGQKEALLGQALILERLERIEGLLDVRGSRPQVGRGRRRTA